MTAKQSISELHAKFYGKGSKAKKQEAKVNKVIKEKAAIKLEKANIEVGGGLKAENAAEVAQKPSDLVVKPEGVTANRNNLMLEAKLKGVKNFRILNKQELIDCLAHLAEPEYVKKVVDAAIIRWQSGWKKNKEGEVK